MPDSSKPPMQAPSHGAGRELGDEELFDDSPFPSYPPRNRGPPSLPSYANPTTNCASLAAPRPSTRPLRRPSISTAAPLLRRVETRQVQSATMSPRTVDDTVARIALCSTSSAPPSQWPDGVPRLSALALIAVRRRIVDGQLSDLSRLPDAYALDVLAHAHVAPRTLTRLQMCNHEALIPLLDAAWALLVRRRFGLDEREADCPSWRACFERRVAHHGRLVRRAGERVRAGYGAAAAGTAAAAAGTVAGDGAGGREASVRRLQRMPVRHRGVRGGSTTIERLRMEIRRTKRRRRR